MTRRWFAQASRSERLTMLHIVLTDGKSHEILECVSGVNPDVLIIEKYPGWVTVDTANSRQEAQSLIEIDRKRRQLDSF
jgi:hypothetical protein